MSDPELEPLVTACPHCSTRFRVTEGQLAIAAGKVRCGACLQVFQGVEFLVWEEQPESDQAAEDALDEVLDSLAHTQEMPQVADVQAPSLTDTSDTGNPRQLTEQQAEDILAAVGRSFEVRGDESESVSEPSIPDTELQDYPDTPEQPQLTDERSPLIVAPDAAAALGDESDDTVFQDDVEEQDVEEQDVEEQHVEEQIDDRDYAPGFSTGNRDPIVKINTQAQVVSDEPDDSQTWGFGVEPTPPRPLWLRLGLVAGILGLVVQLFWYQFDSWGRQPFWRPFYAGVCGLLPCELPVRHDLSLLESERLVVRSHPEVEGALIVDALIVNNASFEQPFPLIELIFSNLAGRQVAARRFTPDEYLGGDLHGALLMEPGRPIRIALELADPGTDAVNYRMQFR